MRAVSLSRLLGHVIKRLCRAQRLRAKAEEADAPHLAVRSNRNQSCLTVDLDVRALAVLVCPRLDGWLLNMSASHVQNTQQQQCDVHAENAHEQLPGSE